MRFSGSGDGLLHSDCTTGTPSVCGLLNHKLEDPAADIRTGEPDRLALAFKEDVPGAASLPGRLAFDIQRQMLPVIFVPGFLGSEIKCGSRTLWPGLPAPDPLGMTLTADGFGNAGCAARRRERS